MPTHEVTNVAPPWRDVDVFTADQALTDQLAGNSADPATLKAPNLKELGTLVGSDQVQEWARQANAHPPVLRTHDRYGHRIDEVEFHPSWHRLLTVAVGHGLDGAPWASAEPAPH